MPDVAQKRNEWIEKIEELDADKCVFIDESGVNIDMTRHYGRAVGKERAVDKTPENTPTNNHTKFTNINSIFCKYYNFIFHTS